MTCGSTVLLNLRLRKRFALGIFDVAVQAGLLNVDEKQAKTGIAEQLPDQVDIVNPGGGPWKDASSAAASDGCFTLRLVSIGLGLGVMSRRFCWKGKSSDLWGRKWMVQ